AWYAAAEVITNIWADDAAFVVDALEATSPDIGALDFGRVAYVGHSLGGAAAFEACSRNVACTGAVDLDGTLWTEVRHTGLQAPNLILRRAPEADCDLFCQLATADFAAVLAAGNSVQFSVAGTLHMSFTDLGLVPSPGNNEAYRGPLDPERLIAITRNVVRSFLDQHLREVPGADFAAVAGRYPELTRH
ncbi:MAG: hypothetical protein KIS87_12665, partial [Phycisphaeraceae bacterium]|nr:hypothetical protein [Phycisphaeraceae bacterium]